MQFENLWDQTETVHWSLPELFVVTLRTDTQPVCSVSIKHAAPCPSPLSSLLIFPGLWRKNFSSCCNKSYPSWHDHWPALKEGSLTLRKVWICSSGVCPSATTLYSVDAVLIVQNSCSRERKRLNLCDYLGTPCRVTMNISWADFKTALFLYSFHDGFCGWCAFSINVLCTQFLCAAVYPVCVYSLTCLSQLSTVEKNHRYSDKHKNEQTTI